MRGLTVQVATFPHPSDMQAWLFEDVKALQIPHRTLVSQAVDEAEEILRAVRSGERRRVVRRTCASHFCSCVPGRLPVYMRLYVLVSRPCTRLRTTF